MARFLTALSALLAAGALVVAPAQAQQSSQTTAERIVAIAQQEFALGVHEIPMGSNKATRIKMYGLATQAPLRYYPAPWCAYFTSWVTKQAGVPIGWDGLGDGWVPRLRDWGRKTGIWRTAPQPGDLIAFPQHIGIVESLQPNGLVTTIEEIPATLSAADCASSRAPPALSASPRSTHRSQLCRLLATLSTAPNR